MPMRVNKIEIETLIDSGAFASLIDENYIKILKIENKYIWPDVTTLFFLSRGRPGFDSRSMQMLYSVIYIP